MEYLLKHFDTPLLSFEADPYHADPNIHITWFDEEKRPFLPFDLHPTEKGLWSWVKRRSIPSNRTFVRTLLSRCGLDINRPMGIIAACKGLSLNDCYWVVEKDFEGSFADCNLYDNRLNNVLAYLAFTGHGSSNKGPLSSSPEFTTNGMLPKYWHRQNKTIYLYKGGTSGGANTGFEPYSEFYASQIAKIMGINAVSYGLSKRKGILSSTCELFTSKKLSFVSTGKLVTSGGFEAVADFYRSKGRVFEQAFADMVVFDALICNTDRHFGNFGFLVDNATNEIAAPAPLFDHGNSLFCFAWGDDWNSDNALSTYAETLMPCTYNDFIGTAQDFMTRTNREQLRRVLDLSFPRGATRYPLPEKRRAMIERQIRKRARMLLD